MFKTAGLVARYDKKKALNLAQELTRHLIASGLNVCLEDTLEGRIDAAGAAAVPLETMKTDLIITIGGDGTILRTCLAIPKPEPPLLTINMGIRGFMTEVDPTRAVEAVDRCLAGDYKIKESAKLASRTDDQQLPDALNEVVITHAEPAKILYTRILKDGIPILTCQSDSLMISTQTGSTGYSLSARGPVIDPELDALVLNAICPLSDFRPIVFAHDATLTVEVTKPKEMLVLVDGKRTIPVKSKQPRITLTSSKNKTSFIRFEDDFYQRLKSRLLFKGME